MHRIALYSHDTFGLGHLRRCLKVADHLRAHFGRVDGLLLTGSPWHGLFPVPSGFRVEALPPVVKSPDGRYVSRELGVDLEGLLATRRALISSRMLAFEPDLFVVDNVPCGLHGEILPALAASRKAGCRTVLALRDVLDDLETIRRQWERAGAFEATQELFDEIWVFGDAIDTDTLVSEGPLAAVASKVHCCGRIGHLQATAAPEAADRADRAAPASPRPLVLVTGGGGRDASPLMRTYLEAVAAYRPAVTSHLVLGPDFPRQARADLATQSEACDSALEVIDFVPDLPTRLARSEVIVSMAGYNTVCEILASGRPAVLIPRVTPRQEQLLRSQRLAESGQACLIDPRELSPAALWSAVDRLLVEQPARMPLPFPGGPIAARRAAALLGVAAGGAR